ncbi:syntaxin-6-like isoform X2 [Oppia nitens]|uniref:syntaxin-6-like isoform X2 n=1 Tax=Oppia nitens TaxID=1686743 RepID=UPI0023DC557B|nr:syntaxin-6-like isoform X2 [Oppia nitens]
MSLEDPFFVVRDEVLNALTKCRNYFERWTDFLDDPNSETKEEIDRTTTELRNGLRSIEWDLEDLEETIGIVENNPKKFKLDETEINSRRKFIHQTKDEVKFMREKLFDNQSKDKKQQQFRQSLSNFEATNASKYTRLDNNTANTSTDIGITVDEGSHLQHQQRIFMSQNNDTYDKLRESVGNLKSISRQMGTEVDEHAVMLDEFGHEMDINDSRFDTRLKKIARVLHLSNERRRWAALGALIVIILIILIILII